MVDTIPNNQYIFMCEETKDTILGSTGEVINGKVVKSGDGKYSYRAKMNGDEEYKAKQGGFKEKRDEDSDVKMKDGDTKKKVEGETGEVKNK